jgi:hypothetical protein
LHTRLNFWFLPSAAILVPTDNLHLLERAAVAQARQKREQYLRALDELLNSFGIAGEAAALDETRAMFAHYEKPGMPTLSAEIEAMRAGWMVAAITRTLKGE